MNFAACFNSEFDSLVLHPCILQFCLLHITTSKVSLSHRKVQETYFSAFSDLSPNSSLIRHGSQVIILTTHLEFPSVYQLWILAVL